MTTQTQLYYADGFNSRTAFEGEPALQSVVTNEMHAEFVVQSSVTFESPWITMRALVFVKNFTILLPILGNEIQLFNRLCFPTITRNLWLSLFEK